MLQSALLLLSVHAPISCCAIVNLALSDDRKNSRRRCIALSHLTRLEVTKNRGDAHPASISATTMIDRFIFPLSMVGFVLLRRFCLGFP
jgi:hypothetical protein